jgi:LuxR family maltose regulon positive regulatory protein
VRRQRRRPRSPFGATVTGELESLSLPPGLTAETIEVGGETLVVFAFPGKRDAPSPLTEAEQHIVDLVLQGCTTAQIAATRGVARTTVSSQLQSIYRKLGITSRIELVCKLG